MNVEKEKTYECGRTPLKRVLKWEKSHKKRRC